MTDTIRHEVEQWMPMLEYYMEDSNIPTETAERTAYYARARAYLADRFAELYSMVKREETRCSARLIGGKA